jgi:hypothetical protein
MAKDSGLCFTLAYEYKLAGHYTSVLTYNEMLLKRWYLMSFRHVKDFSERGEIKKITNRMLSLWSVINSKL